MKADLEKKRQTIMARNGGTPHFMRQGHPMFIPPGMLPQMMMNGRHFSQPRYPPPTGEFGAPAEKEFYELLKVPVTASEADIRKAYRELSRKHHPDKGGDTQLYQNLTQTHSILSDPEKRACYDAYGAEYEKTPNIHMFVQDLRPEDLEITLRLSTRDCIKGQQRTLNYRRTNAQKRTEMASTTVNVPANVSDGHRMVFRGQGNVEPGKSLPGNLVVIVTEHVAAGDQGYKRVGGPDGLVLFRKSITLAQAVCGNPLELELPDGTQVSFVQAVIRPGQWYLVESTSPPMYLTFDVEFPEELREEQHEGLRGVFNLPAETHEVHSRVHVVPVPREAVEQRANEAKRRVYEDAAADTPQQAGGPGVQECRTQ